MPHVETLGLRQLVTQESLTYSEREPSPDGIQPGELRVIRLTKQYMRRKIGEALVDYADTHGPILLGPLRWREGAANDDYTDPLCLMHAVDVKVKVLPVLVADDTDWAAMAREVTS